MHKHILDSLGYYLISRLPLKELLDSSNAEPGLADLLKIEILNDKVEELRTYLRGFYNNQKYIQHLSPDLAILILTTSAIVETLSRHYSQAYELIDYAESTTGANNFSIPIKLARATLGSLSSRVGSTSWKNSLHIFRDTCQMAVSKITNRRYIAHSLLAFVRLSCCERLISDLEVIEQSMEKARELVQLEHQDDLLWEARINQCEAAVDFQKGIMDRAHDTLSNAISKLDGSMKGYCFFKIEMMLDLASVCIQQRRPRIAKEILREAIVQEMLGPKEKLRLALLFHNLAEAEYLNNCPKAAFPIFQEAIQYYDKLQGKHLYDRLAALFWMQRWDEMSPLERRSINEQIENINRMIDQDAAR